MIKTKIGLAIFIALMVSTVSTAKSATLCINNFTGYGAIQSEIQIGSATSVYSGNFFPWPFPFPAPPDGSKGKVPEKEPGGCGSCPTCCEKKDD